jgi:hypothetical protein
MPGSKVQKGSTQTTFLVLRTVPTQIAQTPASAQQPCAPGAARTRATIAGKLVDFDKARGNRTSQRRFTKEQGIPRSTLQGWLEQRQSIDASPEEIAFFESPAGVAFLHRLIVAAHLVMSLMGACGVRLVCLFLVKAGLARFVASSYGAQRKVARAVEQETVNFGRAERVRLGAQMQPRKVTLANDETFHPQPCLVAIEPVSGFIVAEQYSPHRDTASWKTVMDKGLLGLPVQVHQVTSDEAQALVRYVEVELGVHRSPDVFHVQYEVSRGTSAPLAAQTRHAQAAQDQASLNLQKVLQQQDQDQAQPAGPGRPIDWEGRRESAQLALQQAQQQAASAAANQDAMGEVIRGIGTSYHPFDLGTGVVRTAAEARTEFGVWFDKARAVAKKADLPQRCFERIEKAARVVPKMVATIAFFHALVAQWVGALALPQQASALLLRVIIPMLYLKRAAQVAKDAATREALNQVVSQLESALRAPPPAWLSLPDAVRHQAWALAQQCADLFQRSSSCVEGRNGVLALRHHHLHQISVGRLEALTVVHNYMIRRTDGTTAAHRFFGAPPGDLFATLCQRIPLPSRPRKGKRAKARAATVVAPAA